MSKLKQFVVTAVPNQKTWHPVDKEYFEDALINGAIIEYYNCETDEKALDIFHSSEPIKCLDDWEIEANEMNPEISSELKILSYILQILSEEQMRLIELDDPANADNNVCPEALDYISKKYSQVKKP